MTTPPVISLDELGDLLDELPGVHSAASVAELPQPVTMHQVADVMPASTGTGGPEGAVSAALVELRQATRQVAAEALHGAVSVVRAALHAGDVDYDDALKAMARLQPVVEHFEKLEAAERGGNRPGEVVHLTIDLSAGSIAATTAPPMVDVVDVQERPATTGVASVADDADVVFEFGELLGVAG